MKKISCLELSAIFLTIIITFNSRINMYILKDTLNNNAWMAIIASYLLGIIPLLMTLYIANYKPELNLFEKIKDLFGKIAGDIINIIIGIILSVIAITILNNTTNFITTQFLYHTPKIITSTMIIIIAIYATQKEINVISHISIILIAMDIITFIIANLSIIPNIKSDNLLPIIIETNNILVSSVKLTINNILPIISILIIPKNKIDNPTKYNKTLIIAYIIGFIITILTNITTISTLGIYLAKSYEYAEYIALKTIKLFGFLERTENIISLRWITEAYIYITFLIYTINKSITNNKKYPSIIIGLIIIIITKYLFNNIALFNNYLKKEYIIITSIIFIIYIVTFIKILFKKRKISK